MGKHFDWSTPFLYTCVATSTVLGVLAAKEALTPSSYRDKILKEREKSKHNLIKE